MFSANYNTVLISTLKKAIAFSLFYLYSTFCFSQQVINIQGCVLDSTKVPIQYATIKLDVFLNDTLILGAITDDNGVFAIRNIPRKRFKITVSSIGFSPFRFEFDSLADNISLVLDTIVLQPSSTELEEVVVQGEKTGMKSLVDKDVFIPDAQSLKSSATGLDLLSKIPGVRIRPKDQEISVAGSSNVLILINGASSDRNISAINPRNIERIEIINNPTAAYESDVLVVLNIVLKPVKEKGLQLATNLEYSFVNLQNNSNAQIGYVFNKFRFFAGYNAYIFREENVKYTRNRIDLMEEGENEYHSQSSNNHYRTNNHRLQYGSDFQINEKNTLSFTGNMVLSDFIDHLLLHSRSLHNNHEVLRSVTYEDVSYDAKQHNYNLFYNYKFEPGQELKLNSNVFFMDRTQKNEYSDSTYYLEDMVFDKTFSKEKTINKMQSINVKIDYTHTINEVITLNSGYQFYNRCITNEFFESVNLVLLKYIDYRNSIYSEVRLKRDKISFRTGIRLENLNTNISDTLSNQKTHPLPLGAIMYSINQSNNISLNYNRRLRYPTYRMLIPFEYYSGDMAFVSAGNPDLKPEKQHRLSLRHTYRKNEVYISSSLYYRQLDDVFGMERMMGNGVLRSIWENIDWAKRIGLGFSGSANFFDFIDFDAYINIYQSYYSVPQYNGLSYSAYIGFLFYMPFDLLLGVDLSTEASESQIDMHIYESPFIESISLSKEVFKGKGNIEFAMINPFMTTKFSIKSWDDTFEDLIQMRYKTPVYLLKFTYFFSAGKKVQRLQREQIMQEEQIK